MAKSNVRVEKGWPPGPEQDDSRLWGWLLVQMGRRKHVRETAPGGSNQELLG